MEEQNSVKEWRPALSISAREACNVFIRKGFCRARWPPVANA